MSSPLNTLDYAPPPPARGLLAALKAQPDAPVRISEPAVINQMYRYWRVRILATSLIGYAIFYFVRTNISVALPFMGKELGYSKSQLGIILSVGGVVYGISKFANGFLGDRANPRYFMAFGLFICALMNLFFGLSSSLMALGTFWLMNNWAQGMGFPPCARNMGYWFSPRERGFSFGVWHTGHMIGAALVSVLCSWLIKEFGNWRLCFYVPAGMAVFGSLMILIFLRDTPGSMGLPPVEVYKGEETESEVKQEVHEGADYWKIVIEFVFKNPFMWIISVGNLLVYTLRYAALHWGPTLLQEMKGLSVMQSGWLPFGFEMSGMVGALIAGWVTDKVFGGRAGRVCVIAMILMTLATFLFWKAPVKSPYLAAACFFGMGFCIYIPQMLIAAMAMNLGTKRAAAAAVGLTGIFGYASSVISGYGIGKLVDTVGWDGAFEMLLLICIATAVLMLFTWNVGAHPDRIVRL